MENNLCYLIWKNSGKPEHKFTKHKKNNGNCATCGSKLNTESAALKSEAVGTDFSRQSDFLPFGDYICEPCAWLYSYPKETHRNVIAFEDRVIWPMISSDSATEERPTWAYILNYINQNYNKSTKIVGLMTTDPKPRLWPMTESVTIHNFGLYVHCSDYNISEFINFSLEDCIEISSYVSDLISDGFSKISCLNGLLKDYKRVKKDISSSLKKENELKKMRLNNAFIPALIISRKRGK